MNEKTKGTLVLLFPLLTGLLFASIGGDMLWSEYKATTDYVAVDATVVSSNVDIDESRDLSSRENEIDRTHYPNVTYQYTVDGTTYTNDNVFPGPGRYSKGVGKARDVVENHPEGKQVTVYVNDADPTESYLLDETEPLAHGAFLVVGLGLLGFSGYYIRKIQRGGVEVE
jgi:hypothetical protein